LIEQVELTLSHVGLGSLGEYALMTLFANSLFHRLAVGKQRPPAEIVDKNGEMLYPGFYTTHLTVPPNRLLEQHRAWQKFSVGVEVHSFGGMLFESQYVLADPDEISDDFRTWDLNSFPSMRGSSMFIVDRVGREAEVSIPKAGLIADLPKLAAPPAAMERFRKLRAEGSASLQFDANLKSHQPISRHIGADRDATTNHNRPYRSHTMLFARFIEIMDQAEREFLTEQMWPPFPSPLLDSRTVIGRETYYFGTPQPDDVVQIGVVGQLTPCPVNFHGASSEIISAGLLTFLLEIYDQRTKALLAISKVKKLLAVPSAEQTLLHDAQRLAFHYGSGASLSSPN